MSNISMELVKKLRDRTQVGMMDCKKALEQANGDFEKAVEFLRKKGAAVAAKRADNVTNHGRIEGFVNASSTAGALVEMACETDFSANTDSMRIFAGDVAEQIVQGSPSNLDDVLNLSITKHNNISVREHLDGLVAKICENIKINNFVRFAVETHGIVNAYIHPGSTVGVLVALETNASPTANIEELRLIAKDICMQIAVTNPLCIRPEELDLAAVEKERAFAMDQLKDSGKPAQVIEKIIEGKIGKFYQDVCLINQPFIKNDKQTITQYLDEAGKKFGFVITIKQIRRFAIGR